MVSFKRLTVTLSDFLFLRNCQYFRIIMLALRRRTTCLLSLWQAVWRPLKFFAVLSSFFWLVNGGGGGNGGGCSNGGWCSDSEGGGNGGGSTQNSHRHCHRQTPPPIN